jgi:ferredoxin
MHSIGVAEVAVSVCWLTEGRECGRCVAVCPYDAIRVQTDGFDSRVVVRREQCTGCGACEQECPTRPTRAITVRPLTS